MCFFTAPSNSCGHLIDQDDGQLIFCGEAEQLLCHAVEQPRSQGHVAKILPKVKGDAVNHHQLDLMWNEARVSTDLDVELSAYMLINS